MFKFKAVAIICLLGLFSGCASSIPRELAEKKFIPGGQYFGKADNYRPKEIKYQKLPDDVQYVRANDALVIDTYNKLKIALSTEEDHLAIAKILFIMSGTWDNLVTKKQDGTFNRRRNSYTFDTGKEKFKFHYAIPKTAKSARNAWNTVKHEIRRPNIYTAEAGSDEANALAEINIRAISTEEMETIGWFTPFKIIEPIFVVNDRYLLGFNSEGKLEVLDEIPYYVPFYEKLKVVKAEQEQQRKEMLQKQQQILLQNE